MHDRDYSLANVLGWRSLGKAMPDEDPDQFVKGRAKYYSANIESAAVAYDAHPGPKMILRYEDLLANTEEVLRQLYTALHVHLDDEEIARAVEKHAWHNLPLEEKGEGKFNRRGEAGVWRDELTPRQVQIIERKNAQLMGRFGYALSS